MPDTLYRNNGDGTFTDVSGPSGIASVAGPGMGMVCGDFDDDGDTDVFVVQRRTSRISSFRTTAAGRFQEVGLVAGVAYDFSGKENSSMGVDCGDYDNDGRLDLFMTDYQGEMPVLYHNLGDGFFEDATSRRPDHQRPFPRRHLGDGIGRLRQRRGSRPVHRLRSLRPNRGHRRPHRPPQFPTFC